MDTQVFCKQHIHFNKDVKTQDEAFLTISKIAYEAGFVRNSTAYYKGLKARELEITTGFKDGIAIPHSKNETCLKPGVFFIRFDHPIEWYALDGNAIHVVIALTIPMRGGEEHLRLLSTLARKLMNEEFRNKIKNSDVIDHIYDAIMQV